MDMLYTRIANITRERVMTKLVDKVVIKIGSGL